ncbi:hypothetical protein BH10BDE1_BH10BDE1_18100 [soil metagenome]
MLNTRVTVQFRFAIMACALLIASSLLGCKSDSNYFASANASVGGADGATSDATVGFRVRLKARVGVDGFMHKFGDINSACEIATTAIDTPTEINCLMNMMEYDLWFYGYEYEVNVPVGNADHQYCAFLREIPHRYYKGQAGYGPDNVAIVMTDGNMTTCSINGAAGTIDATAKTCSNAEATFSSSGSVVTCAYDYSQRVGAIKGPNCCGGLVNASVTTITNSVPPTPTTVVPSKAEYGGKVANCIESANDFIDQWPKDRDTSLALNLITQLGNGGLVRSQKLPSVFALANVRRRVETSSDFFNAGFHGWSDYVANAATYSATTVVPKAMDPKFDLGADGSHSGPGATALPKAGTGAVVFECLNGAGEVRHRINMYAVGWNTIEDFQDFKKNGAAGAVDPNVTGTAGVNCSAVNGLGSCNTIWGFDDMILGAGPINCAGDPSAYCYPYEGSRGSPP